MIRIKCDYLNGAVAVPTDVIDKHLKLAPVASFKVLLFILRNSDCTTDAAQISVGTGLSKEDVEDCIEYWKGYGIIAVDNITDTSLSKKAIGNLKSIGDNSENEKLSEKKEKKVIRSLPVKKPTQREIAMRMNEEPSLKIMYTEAQNILGTFGYDTQAILLMIHDYYGMSEEMIITLVQYQKSIKSTSTASIKARAEDWAKRGIDSLTAVDNELLLLEKIDNSYKNLKPYLGTQTEKPTPRVHRFLRDWICEWNCSEELIKYALEESGKTLTDTDKLLKKLARQGITSPKQAMDKAKKSLPKEVKKTYDTEKVGRNSVLDWTKKFAEGENK